MKNIPADVPSYIESSPSQRRPVLLKLRAICQKVLAGCKEGIDYGMPCYKKDGAMVAGFASQKNHVAVYACGGALEAHREALAGASLGKGCVRYADPQKIDFEAIKGLLELANAANAANA